MTSSRRPPTAGHYFFSGCGAMRVRHWAGAGRPTAGQAWHAGQPPFLTGCACRSAYRSAGSVSQPSAAWQGHTRFQQLSVGGVAARVRYVRRYSWVPGSPYSVGTRYAAGHHIRGASAIHGARGCLCGQHRFIIRTQPAPVSSAVAIVIMYRTHDG